MNIDVHGLVVGVFENFQPIMKTNMALANVYA